MWDGGGGGGGRGRGKRGGGGKMISTTMTKEVVIRQWPTLGACRHKLDVLEEVGKV